MAADPGHFEPMHAAHAIEQVAFVLQVDRSLEDTQLGEAVAAVQEQFGGAAGELPGRADIQTMTFSFGPLGHLGQGPVPTGGRVYNRTRQDGTLESELRVERLSIVYRTTAYTRWADIWGRARRYFATLLPVYTQVGTITAINLNFQDKFFWDGDIALCRPAALLRPQSNYVCPHVYAARDLWHSHTGAFSRADANTKRLLNVNLDCLDETATPPQRRFVAITTGLTDQLNQSGYTVTALHGADAVNYLDQHLPVLHNLSKDTFRNVINDAMCQRIALDD
jgi:uncharacterized protein (TIGR04255 family)